MPISKANLEALTTMLAAISQRQQTIQQLVAQLHAGVVWRSPDGSLTVDIAPAEAAQLEAFVKAYLDETDSLTGAARAILADKP